MRPAVLLALVLAACSSAPEHPNVLVVTIDTLRVDATGHATPAMDAFFREAARFRSARTVSPLTLPAHVSLFTGLLPAHHGIHDNVTEPLPPRTGRPFPLLAEEFRDAGYATAAFVARAVLAEETGIAGGFDLYDCPTGSSQSLDDSGEVVAEERVRAPIEWLEKRPEGRPWFVWVHLYDPHAPYLPFPGDSSRPATRDVDPTATLYAGEVRRADAALEKLLGAAGRDTIVLLASDHGEGLGEHGEAEHGPLCYGTTTDIVLALRALRPLRAVGGLRSIMDAAPTLRRLCHLPPREADGKDLEGVPHETLVSESLFMWRLHGWGQSYSVTDGDFTLVESGPRVELFDRRHDPGEARPLPLSLPAYETLDRALQRFRSASLEQRDGEVFSSVSAYGTLRRNASRYLSGLENGQLLDPQAHLKTWMAMETVPPTIRLALDRRDPIPLQQALTLLSDLERETRTSPRIPLYRAGVCAAMATLTGEDQWRQKAVWAQLDAIEKGYDRKTIGTAIRMAVEAKDPEALRKLVALLAPSQRKLDEATATALTDAAAVLGLRDEEIAPALTQKPRH